MQSRPIASYAESNLRQTAIPACDEIVDILGFVGPLPSPPVRAKASDVSVRVRLEANRLTHSLVFRRVLDKSRMREV